MYNFPFLENADQRSWEYVADQISEYRCADVPVRAHLVAEAAKQLWFRDYLELYNNKILKHFNYQEVREQRAADHLIQAMCLGRKPNYPTYFVHYTNGFGETLALGGINSPQEGVLPGYELEQARGTERLDSFTDSFMGYDVNVPIIEVVKRGSQNIFLDFGVAKKKIKKGPFYWATKVLPNHYQTFSDMDQVRQGRMILGVAYALINCFPDERNQNSLKPSWDLNFNFSNHSYFDSEGVYQIHLKALEKKRLGVE